MKTLRKAFGISVCALVLALPATALEDNATSTRSMEDLMETIREAMQQRRTEFDERVEQKREDLETRIEQKRA